MQKNSSTGPEIMYLYFSNKHGIIFPKNKGDYTMENQKEIKTKEQTKKCKYCQADIPKKARVCPVCRRKQGGGCLSYILIALIIVFVIIPTWMGCSVKNSNSKPKENKPQDVVDIKTTGQPVENTENEEEYKASCEEYSYKDVLRNPEQYVGKRVKVTVKISSVHEESWANDTKYYFAYTESQYGWYGDRYGIIDCREAQDPKLLTDDIITVYGEISDPQQTSSLIVTSEEVFCINMKYIDFISE